MSTFCYSDFTLNQWLCRFLGDMVLSGPERELRSNEIINERVRHLVVSDSLWPHGLQHIRLPCPPLSPRVCSNSWSLGQWCHSTISSSIVPFSSCLQSFPELGSFPMSWHFASGGQNFGASASASVLPMNIRVDFLYSSIIWSPFCPGDSQESSPTPQFESITSLAISLPYGPTPTSVHDYWKNHSFN